MLWVGFEGTAVPPALAAALVQGDYGATILFKRNLTLTQVAGGGVLPQEVCDLDALEAMTRALHVRSVGGAEALVAIDQEGGVVQRVKAPATQWPPMLSFDRFAPPEDAALAREVGEAMGSELRALGIDIDFAPVLDIHTNPGNPIIGDRAFGTEPEAVARRALAFAQGLADAGILACGKHFPGHGDTTTDSHLELPWVRHDRARLESIELAPFARAAAMQLPMLMTAHVMFPALDDRVPATMSASVITGILRQRMGYQGLIVSDDLDMAAVAREHGADAAAVAAVRAGCDVLLVCRDQAHMASVHDALRGAAETDAELRAKIGAAAARIAAFKRAHAAMQRRIPAPPRSVVGRFEHRRLADRLAGR